VPAGKSIFRVTSSWWGIAKPLSPTTGRAILPSQRVVEADRARLGARAAVPGEAVAEAGAGAVVVREVIVPGGAQAPEAVALLLEVRLDRGAALEAAERCVQHRVAGVVHSYAGVGGIGRPARTASTTALASAGRYSSP